MYFEDTYHLYKTERRRSPGIQVKEDKREKLDNQMVNTQ